MSSLSLLTGQDLPDLCTTVPGERSRVLVDRLAARECPAITARRSRRAEALGVSDTDPIVWAESFGANVRDADGNVFVDLTAGFGVASVGHRHPAVVAAGQDQLGRLPHAMGDAFHMIQHGGAEVIVTGGSEAAVTPMGISGFQNMRALSTRNDEPTRASRPFDIDRDGFVLSEGAGILVFEELEHAKARGVEIQAEVLGFGMSCDASHITQPNEQGIGAAKAMSNALESGDLCPDDIDYINAHGTSTPLGDKAETAALKSVFGDHAYNLSVSSTKSQLGHSLGASGGIELVLSIKAVQNGVVPPTINLENPDPDCDLDYTPNEPRQRKLNIVMSNSFGFGGHNASIIVGRYDRNGD